MVGVYIYTPVCAYVYTLCLYICIRYKHICIYIILIKIY